MTQCIQAKLSRLRRNRSRLRRWRATRSRPPSKESALGCGVSSVAAAKRRTSGRFRSGTTTSRASSSAPPCSMVRGPCTSLVVRLADFDPPAGTAAGLPPLAQFIYDFTTRVYRPATSDFKTVINAGSTDAWGKIVTSLCNPGDGVLAEEWTYPCVLFHFGLSLSC